MKKGIIWKQEMCRYPRECLKKQSPFARMMHDGPAREKGMLRHHCNMRMKVEQTNLAAAHKRAPYDAPFPVIFGSDSQ